MLLFPYPKFAARRLYNKREVIYQTLIKYIKSPQEKRTGECWVMRKILEEQKIADIGDKTSHRSYSCSSGRTCAEISGTFVARDLLILLQSEHECV